MEWFVCRYGLIKRAYLLSKWNCWRLDNPKDEALMAFDKQGIVAMLPRPSNFLDEETRRKILSYEAKIGADGRLYVAQYTEEAFFIFEANMSSSKQ